jgi:phytoene dehydrogenase-like protein
MKIYSVMESNIYEGTRPGGFAVVLYHDYCTLEQQYASYREAAAASIGADLNQQAIERIQLLEDRLQRFKRLTIQDDEHDKLWDECFTPQREAK